MKIKPNLLIIAGVLLIFFFEMSAQKTDTIVHINGNVLLGDFKKMQYGVVTWKMDGMGTISLEEPKISTIISSKEFEIKMETGATYYGSFLASKEKCKVILFVDGEKILVNVDDIVEVYPIKRNFFMRTSGNFSLGANFSKASNVATVAFSGNFTYRKRKSHLDFIWDSNNTYQGDTLSASKSDITLGWEQTLRKGWYSNVSIGANQNLELGTERRWTLNLAGIRDLIYNDWNRLYLGMGLNLSQESSFNSTDVTNDVAGLIIVKWKVYKLTNPKLWVDADITFLPYFTDPGRNRFSFNLNPQVSIFSNNLKVGMSFYYTFDSKPTTEAAANDDYGLNLQLTYYYH